MVSCFAAIASLSCVFNAADETCYWSSTLLVNEFEAVTGVMESLGCSKLVVVVVIARTRKSKGAMDGHNGLRR